MFRNMHFTRPRKARSFSRLANIEQLERRDMLTAGPHVVEVEVASTSWSSAFVRQFQSIERPDRVGYDIPLGSSAQSDVLPWTNLDRIRIKFDTHVSINSADLSISGVNVVAFAIKSFRYDPQTDWATWTLAT